jgi:secreted PhoX family phosphatase
MRTAADPEGTRVLGTFSGCAHGWTPWGTYLTCEENWQFQFMHRGQPTAAQRRYKVAPRNFSYRWEEFDERFDTALHPNEPHRFGWVVEVDPYDPGSAPVKRTGLGRFMHEGAACAVGPDRRLAFYMADDDAFEYVYKFVTARPYDPSRRAANRDLLDAGTLYVARFDAGGRGEWLPLTASNISRDHGEILVHARLAADALGATKMDRPEWIMPHPVTREVYCSLTSNTLRGMSGLDGPNPANPRENNVFGHILRWREARNDPASTRFEWEIFALGGENSGDALAGPDALWIDAMGTLWVGTDASSSALENNQVFAVDPQTRVFRRFLTGPRGCEMTGFVTTPDNRTAFVNVQHPGEGANKSNWPDYAPNGRPRSATVVIRRKDGGIIGT